MARPPATTNAEIIAAIAQMEEQIGTLQRERREDKAAMQREVSRLENVFKDGLTDLKADIVAQLAPIKTELAPLTVMRWKAAGLGAGLLLLGGWLGQLALAWVQKHFPGT